MFKHATLLSLALPMLCVSTASEAQSKADLQRQWNELCAGETAPDMVTVCNQLRDSINLLPDGYGSGTPSASPQGTTANSGAARSRPRLPPRQTARATRVPVDESGRECGSYSRLPDRTVLGDRMYNFQASNSCSQPITFNYRFDGGTSTSLSIPAGGTRTFYCIDVTTHANLRCSGQLVEASFQGR
jgi:hypothetical protein